MVSDPASSVFDDGIRDVLEEGGFACARWCDDETALAFADGAHHIDDPRGVPFWRCF